jgi:hypothetical protein
LEEVWPELRFHSTKVKPGVDSEKEGFGGDRNMDEIVGGRTGRAGGTQDQVLPGSLEAALLLRPGLGGCPRQCVCGHMLLNVC